MKLPTSILTSHGVVPLYSGGAQLNESALRFSETRTPSIANSQILIVWLNKNICNKNIGNL